MPNRNRGPETVVKITDVASLAGVAPMTVSRVINTPDRVSPATAAKVRAAIEQLGYMPNLVAGGLSSRRTRMIAAIVPTIASPMFNEPVRMFTELLGRSGYHVMLGLSGYAPGGEDELIRAILTRRPDGLLLTGARRAPDILRLLHHARIPVVEIWDMSDQPTDVLVGFDHAEVGAAVADFFHAAGHTQYAMLAAGDPRAAARQAGFTARVAQHGHRLVAAHTLPAPSSIKDGRQGLHAIAEMLNGRTALFCSSDLVAFGVMTQARVLGIAVPEQLAVCGFGDFEISRDSEPAFSTVQVNGGDIGRIAAEQLIARINGGPSPIRVPVPFRIISRAST